MFTGTDGVHHETGIPPSLVRPELIAAMKADAHRLLPPAFADVIGRMEGMFVQAIYNLESNVMGRGRVAIIGDAAFVARPHCGAGVSKAAEDAASLATALSTNHSIEDAIAAFFPPNGRRRERQQSNGPRISDRIFRWTGPAIAAPGMRQTGRRSLPSTSLRTRASNFRKFAERESAKPKSAKPKSAKPDTRLNVRADQDNN